jgi:hypothetical protein
MTISLIGMFVTLLVARPVGSPQVTPERKLPVVKSSESNSPISINGTPEVARTHLPVVNPFFMLSGALLADSFDGTELDSTFWSRPPWLVRHHKTIGVKIENGHLVISGPSHPVQQYHQYAGVISKYFRETDVVLAAEMQVSTPFKWEGRIQHIVHLCSGDAPDFFTEIIFGKIAAVEPPRWHTAYLARVWEYSGHGTYLEPSRPASGSEASGWHTVVLVHDGPTSKAQNYLLVNDQWIPIGPSHSVRFNHSHIELKVDVNIPNLPVHMALDNVRLYVNPAHNPVTIVVGGGGVIGNRPALPIDNRKVQILEDGSHRLLGEALTDEGGEARIILRSDVLYPAAATIMVCDGMTPVVQAKIPRKAVSGLFPGDVWALDQPRKRFAK